MSDSGQVHTSGFRTRSIHAGQYRDEATGAVITPLFLTSTYEQPAPGEHLGYEYSRSANPTRKSFEACIANLESARFGFATASGNLATGTAMFLLGKGDHVVTCDDLYGGTVRLFNQLFTRFGIEFTYVDMTRIDALRNAMRDNTRMVWVETPSNPLTKIVDIAAAADIAHTSQAILAVDNTFLSPVFQRPIELGADLVVHSTTKYLNGHSDLVAGVMITDDEALGERLAFISNALGTIQATFDAWLSLRSLKTLDLRMRAHERNAMALAEWLSDHPKVARVYYPGLAEHPQHQVAVKQMSGFGGMLSFDIKGGLEAARCLLGATRVFTLAESLGGVESLIEHPALMTHASMPKAMREAAGVTDALIRVSVGIEDIDDLRQDLERALQQV